MTREVMNRITREHYPASSLPEDLREGLPSDADVRVTLEWAEQAAERPLSLDELFAVRRPPFRTTEEIVEEIRTLRDERDD